MSIDEDSARIGAEFVDASTRAKSALKGLALTIGRMVSPAVSDALNAVSQALSTTISFVRNNPRTVTALSATATGVVALTTASIAWEVATSKVSLALMKATTALKRLWAAMLANPTAALVGAAAAVILSLNAISKARERAFAPSDNAWDAYEAEKTRRDGDLEDVKTLETLHKKQELQKLSTEEILKAVEIVAKLKAKYGDVGFSVDAVTGKITAAANAQGELNRQMTAARRKELETAIAERKHNLEGNKLELNMADEEVSDFESWTSVKGRGQTWKEAFSERRWFEDERIIKLYLLEKDDDFQTRAKNERAK